jgi:hypothetical protein
MIEKSLVSLATGYTMSDSKSVQLQRSGSHLAQWRVTSVFAIMTFLLLPNSVFATDTVWGFTPFPADITPQAVERAYKLIADDASLFGVHRDDGIPWQEALENKPFPKKIEDAWQERADHFKKGQAVYVGLAPLDIDRNNLSRISKGSKTKSSFLENRLNSKEVKTAYLNYVRRAVDTFKPDFLNIGIEVGELAKRDKRRWADFEELFDYVKAGIKKDHPGIQIGISFGLLTLMQPDVAKLVKPLVNRSDYIGISFYPYMADFDAPPAQWNKPLDWLKQYTSKPIGICETGYTTRPVTLSSPRMEMNGDEALQKRYLQDLAAIAERDNYLFVTWFLPTDYEALSKRAKFKKGDANRLWEYTGLFDPDDNPKQAWSVWQQAVKGKIDPAAPPDGGAVESIASADVAAVTVDSEAGDDPIFQFDMNSAEGAFQGSAEDKIKVTNITPNQSGSSMQWSFEYAKGRFQYVYSALTRGALKGATVMDLMVKGKQDTFLIVSFEEKSGEAYWAVVPVKTEWTQVQLSLSDFQRDAKKANKDGRFQPADVISITVADARAFEGAKGKQSVLLSDWAMY